LVSQNFEGSKRPFFGAKDSAVFAEMRRNSEKTKTTGITTISWVDEIRSLGVFVTRYRKFKCSIDNAKRSYHRAANGIFGKVGRLASEEVVVQLLLHKCMPILLYALEVCALEKRSV